MTDAGFRDAFVFHGLFFLLAVPVAYVLEGAPLGWALLVMVVVYNVALPLAGYWRGYRQWVRLWAFLLPLSLTLPCADWMLVREMQTLVFPDYGVPRLGGAVPVYFMGLWIMLLWPVIWLALHTSWPMAAVAVLSLAGFALWEWAARPMQLWHAVGVQQVAGFALYPLIPEVLLSMAALWLWQRVGHDARVVQIITALGLTVFYTGALALALLWIG